MGAASVAPNLLSYRRAQDPFAAAVCVPYAVTTALMTLRLFVRLRLRNVGREDWLMLGSWSAYTVAFGFTIRFALVGNQAQYVYLVELPPAAQPSRHPPDMLTKAVLANECIFVFSLINIFLAKSSVAFLLVRLLGPSNQAKRRFFYVSLSIYTVVSVVVLILSIISATRRGAFPNENPYVSNNGHTVYHPTPKPEVIILMAWCLVGALLDFSYSIIGILIVRTAHVSRWKLRGLYILFGLGFVAGALATMRAAVSWPLLQLLWEIFLGTNWIFVLLEGPVVMVCGTLPTLLPLWERLRHGKSLRPPRPSPPTVVARERAPKPSRHPLMHLVSSIWVQTQRSSHSAAMDEPVSRSGNAGSVGNSVSGHHSENVMQPMSQV